MRLPEISFKVVEDHSCPLYRVGDEFKLSGDILVLPHDKTTCLILTSDIAKTSKQQDFEDFCKNDRNYGYSFDCSGCTGLVTLTAYIKKEKRIMADKPVKLTAHRPGTVVKSDTDIETIASLLTDFSFFQTLDENEIRELVSLLELRKFVKGDCIIRKGDPGTNLFIIIFGKVEVLGDDGISIAFLGKGEVFGEMSLLSGDPVGATIKIVDPTTILYINGKDFRKVLKRFPDLQMYFARLLAQRLAKTNVVRSEEIASGMIGQLSEMPPSELFQTLNTNQKTGVLNLSLPKGSADLFFRDGCLIGVKYNEEESEEAFYEILKETEGRFRFVPGLPPDKVDAEELGDFMWLLMEGIRRMDEEKGENEI
ncbi:MAG: hypothetical protein B6245_06520 [Desulfobacteraceae bacterium 4572_88]|nr:MAG: hypothetical protein B6245_06520 [Desulfobacteraceae bacterium 4572_88]